MGEGFFFATIVVTLVGYVAFQQWLRHDRRNMIHRERLAALEKGVELPPLEQEAMRDRLTVSRLLLLAGLCWIAIGFAVFGVFYSLAGWVYDTSGVAFPHGLQWIGVALMGIGVSHLIVYFVGPSKNNK